MSIQSTYAPANNLPNPIVSGSGIQGYTDVNGEVWVAANGVNGGNWSKAREALHAVVGRAAAFTCPTGVTTFGWDTIVHDTYGMFSGGPNYGFNIPVAGSYRLFAQYAAGCQSAQYCGIRHYYNDGHGGSALLTNENKIMNQSSGNVVIYSLAISFNAQPGWWYYVMYWQPNGGAGVPGVQCRYSISYIGAP
jgi:hypothetical protein